jgi:hypothetical protein
MVSGISQAALDKLYPNFYNDLKFIGNARLEQKLVAAIREAVALGEQKFQANFGGWYPDSSEFGINPLRPAHIDKTSNRWRWTSGATASVNWSAEDNFISSFNLGDNEIILLYGYFNNSPVQNTLEVRIQPGNVTLPVFQLEPMRMKSEQYMLFPQPIMVSPRSPLKVIASCISTSTSEEAGLLGYFFAPCATLITEERTVS